MYEELYEAREKAQDALQKKVNKSFEVMTRASSRMSMGEVRAALSYANRMANAAARKKMIPSILKTTWGGIQWRANSATFDFSDMYEKQACRKS